MICRDMNHPYRVAGLRADARGAIARNAARHERRLRAREAPPLPGRAEPLDTDVNHYVSGHPLKGPYPDGFQTAIFGMGCFWGVERIFWQLPGVWVTSAGYSGGITPNPTYEEVCTGRTGHTEVVLVVFVALLEQLVVEEQLNLD